MGMISLQSPVEKIREITFHTLPTRSSKKIAKAVRIAYSSEVLMLSEGGTLYTSRKPTGNYYVPISEGARYLDLIKALKQIGFISAAEEKQHREAVIAASEAESRKVLRRTFLRYAAKLDVKLTRAQERALEK